MTDEAGGGVQALHGKIRTLHLQVQGAEAELAALVGREQHTSKRRIIEQRGQCSPSHGRLERNVLVPIQLRGPAEQPIEIHLAGGTQPYVMTNLPVRIFGRRR